MRPDIRFSRFSILYGSMGRKCVAMGHMYHVGHMLLRRRVGTTGSHDNIGVDDSMHEKCHFLLTTSTDTYMKLRVIKCFLRVHPWPSVFPAIALRFAPICTANDWHLIHDWR